MTEDFFCAECDREESHEGLLPEVFCDEDSPQGRYSIVLRDFARTLYSLIYQETLLQRDFKEFLGTNNSDQRVVLEQEVSSIYAYQMFYGLHTALKEYTTVEKSYLYRASGRTPPPKRRIQIHPNTQKESSYVYIPTDATHFVRYKGEPIIITGIWDHDTVSFVITSNKQKGKEDNILARELLSNILAHTRNSLYKNQTITLIEGVLDFQTVENKTWDDIIIDASIQDELKESLVFPLQNKELFEKHSIPWRRGVLLYGEPGTGKTLLCKVLASTQKYTVIWATSRSISRAYHITELFDAARHLSPSLIVFEDIDLLGTSRDVQTSELLGELLSQMDGADQNAGVFVIATTNRPYALDKALVDRPARFDCKLNVTYDNRELRKRLLMLFSKNKPLQLDFDRLAAVTEKMTPAQMQEAIVAASIKALNQDALLKTEDVEKQLKQYTTPKGQEVS